MIVKIYTSAQLEDFARKKREEFFSWRSQASSAVDVYDFVDFVGCKRLRLKGFPQRPLELKRWVNAHISMLAKQFGVNFNPMKYRLQELKLIQK